MIRRARKAWVQGLIAFLWIYGCRISEALAVELQDLKRDQGYLVATLGILKKRVRGPFEAEIHEIFSSREVPFTNILEAYLEQLDKRGGQTHD